MPRNLFPDRIETDRLVFERLDRECVDVFDLYEFVQRDDWQDDATEHMPWFRFQTLDDVASLVESAEQQRADRETARYLLRAKPEDGAIVGLTGSGRSGRNDALARESSSPSSTGAAGTVANARPCSWS